MVQFGGDISYYVLLVVNPSPSLFDWKKSCQWIVFEIKKHMVDFE